MFSHIIWAEMAIFCQKFA